MSPKWGFGIAMLPVGTVWAAANGGVTNGGLRGVWGGRPSWKSAEIGLFRPFSAFFALFRRVRRAPGKSRKRRKKAFFLRYPQICLNPHLLNPHLRHPKLFCKTRDVRYFQVRFRLCYASGGRFVLLLENCSQWGRCPISGWPKIGLLNWRLGSIL